MTVRELILELMEHNPDTPVQGFVKSCYGAFECNEIGTFESKAGDHVTIWMEQVVR